MAANWIGKEANLEVSHILVQRHFYPPDEAVNLETFLEF